MKNKILKRVLLTFMFIAIFFIIYLYAIMVFMPKDETDMGGNKYYAYASFKKEKKNTLDIIMYGNSNVYSGFNPLEMYRQSGITSYACGSPRQTLNAERVSIRDTFKRQKPKLIILDVDSFFTYNTFFAGTNFEKFMPFAAPVEYHVKWKQLSWRDFVTIPKAKRARLKGYEFYSKASNFVKKDNYMQNVTAKPAKIQKSVKKDLNKIVKMCKKNNAALLLICLPTPYSWNNAKCNAVTKLANELNIPYLDLNLPQEGYDLDWSKAFRDSGNHLNIYGATYTTKYLTSYVQENFKDLSFVDHREDEKYSMWQKDLNYYDKLYGKYLFA